MCMRMKMIDCFNVNQHVFGSITGEMSKGDRYLSDRVPYQSIQRPIGEG